MAKLCFRYSVFVFMAITVIVLLPRHTPSATSSPYSRPEKFYLNCGSDSNINYGGWTFVGDMISGCNLVSLNSKGSEASNQSVPEIYGTGVHTKKLMVPRETNKIVRYKRMGNQHKTP
ncbi:hypothetical protein IGI04_002883 [Brassica rapa subsp. trilocularis]|uniref:Uncharacterized protein n=1 Tax=Brassica rapa subsp. trilocularis TaxID=1813537 RepID=A0ABQ7NXJ3_BRACM|nr:hypothetical protein IGI04_002883 [Brassica rapa subsp. trilocularis]